MKTGEKIVKGALQWLGTPYVNGAKVKGAGVDCSMLLIGAMESGKVIKKDRVTVAPYSNEWHLHQGEEKLLLEVKKYCKEIPLSDVQAGDFLLYRYGRCVSHAGIYMGNNQVIHSYINMGVVITDMDDVMFNDAKGRSRLVCAYRWEVK